MRKIMAVGVFDLLHAGHLHYLEQAKALGDHLTVVVAHDDTVRKRKHEPVTNQDLRRRMVEGLKPVDVACVGNPPNVPIFDILPEIEPSVIALGYDQEHAEDRIRSALEDLPTPPLGLAPGRRRVSRERPESGQEVTQTLRLVT